MNVTRVIVKHVNKTHYHQHEHDTTVNHQISDEQFTKFMLMFAALCCILVAVLIKLMCPQLCTKPLRYVRDKWLQRRQHLQEDAQELQENF